jgi:hypothetical protein
VVLICLGGAFFGIYMFWQDLNKTLGKISETAAGIISYKYNGVQRRFSDRFMWSQLQTESPVYDGDIIRTADLSDATISFPGENSIDLAENCLIQIFNGVNGARVELSRGAITATAKSDGLVISSGNKTLTLDAGSTTTTTSILNTLDIQVISGTATLNSDSLSSSGGLVQTLEAGSAVTVGADNSIEIPPRVVSSLPDTQILDEEDGTQLVQFSWQKSNFSATGEVRLEVATDRHFTKLTESLDTTDDGASVSLPPGTWYWRAYPLSQAEIGKNNATVGKLTIASPPPPPVEVPSLEVPVPEVPVPETPVVADAPVVETPALPPLTAPVNLHPATGFIINAAEARRSRSITFTWNAVPGAAAYNFTLYRENTNGTPVRTVRVTRASYTISNISDLGGNGNFIWQVEALSGSRRGEIAESRFTIDIPAPSAPTPGVSGTIYGD